MEGAMKKEFAANVRKTNKSAASGKPAENLTPSSSAATPGKKRKQTGEETSAASSKKTKITMKLGDLEFSIDHDSNETTGGTLKTTATPKSKTSTSTTATPTIKQPKTPQTKKAAPKADAKAKSTKSPINPKAEPSPVKKEPKIKKEPISTQPVPNSTPAKIKQETIKRESSPEPASAGEADINSLTGVYSISCPQLKDQAPGCTDNLRIFLCADKETHKIFGGFELGWKSGVILIANCTDKPEGLQLTFGWRARDSRRGGLDFGKGCYGFIEFRDGGLSGRFMNLFPEPLHFQGGRRPGPLWCGKSAWQFERDWDGFVAEAYGR